jgi:hypothetical protein
MDADELYGLPLDRFIPERRALARALRADARREQAAEVERLRKPSVAAWAVNQLVRTQSCAVAELFDAGDALREAQTDLLAGRGEAGALRAAVERERAAVDALVSAARGLLTSGGLELSPAVIDRVADTMHAAAFDDDARDRVRGAHLERELRHAGLGLIGAPAAAAPVERPANRTTPAKADPQGAKAKADAHDPKAQADATANGAAAAQAASAAQRAERGRARAQAREAARAAESRAQRLADRAARAVQVAEQRRERAAQTLRDADEALAAARAEAETAADAHRRAREQLDGLDT